MSVVTSDWLEKNLSEVKIIDCSWHMPGIDRNPKEEYLKNHIPGAIFFDLDKNSDQNTDLPHMLPTKEKWEEIVSLMGISNNNRVVIYDNSDVLSSCRGWYNFIYFGHNKHLVSVLDGGLKKWLIEKKKTTSEKTILKKSSYVARENKNLVKNILEIKENIEQKNFTVIDARSKERFDGSVPDPRKNVRSGSIQNSVCLPFKEIINTSDNTFKDTSEISKKFNEVIDLNDHKRVFSCGSGITACVLGLAYSLVNNTYSPTVYDGSWAEYGRI
mgnify:FL=1